MAIRGKVKEQIVLTAIDLFNEYGTFKITTNHIIDELEISPGTFYYHFKNKEEIIREIFKRIFSDFELIWDFSKFNRDILDSIFFMLSEMFDLYYNYRFFYLEIATLFNKDPKLLEQYNSINKKHKEKMKVFIKSLQDNKIIIDNISEHDVTNLINNIWIISEFWITFLFLEKKQVNKDNIKNGIFQIFSLIKPYTNDDMSNKITDFIEKIYNISN